MYGRTYDSCMFNGIRQCSRDYFGFTRLVCNKHASDIFNLRSEKNYLCGRRNLTANSVVITVDTPICDYISVIPFPIKLVADPGGTGPFTHNNLKLCVDENSIYNVIANFLSGKDLPRRGYGTEDIRRISQILITYISSGGYQAQENIRGTTYYGDASGPKFAMFANFYTASLQAYWSSRGTDNTNVGIVNMNDAIVLFPVYKLPLFYQAMFVYFEFSNHTYTRRNNAGRYNIPNMVCDVRSGTVHSFNTTEDNELYRRTDYSTYATPLVFFGSVIHLTNNFYLPFEKPEVLPGSFVGVNRPGLCGN